MLKQSRIIFAATFVAVLLFSLFVSPDTAKACGEPPKTLISLYLESDLIVLATVEGNKIIKVEEDEYGTWTQLERNLTIVKTLKGRTDLKTVSYADSEYANKAEDSAEYYEEDADFVKVKIGEQYLFFLMKYEEEDGSSKESLTDYVSGVKDVEGKLEVYEKNLNELGEIFQTKENQTANLIEWIVKSLEETEFRDDAIQELSSSFYALNDEYTSDEEQFLIIEGKYFNTYSPIIAENLSDSQKSRISSVLYSELYDAWFASEVKHPNYGISPILAGINKSQTALYGYNMLQNVHENDFAKKRMIMEFIILTVGDENISEIYYKYINLDDEISPENLKEKAITAEQIKANEAAKINVLKDFSKRFELLFANNFVTPEEKKPETDKMIATIETSESE